MKDGLYHVSLKLAHQPCLVVGGGQVAERKVEGLLSCAADVRVIGPEVTLRLRNLEREGRIQISPRPFDAADVEGMAIVISATDQETVNQCVARACFERGILVNVVDDPEKCSFYVPAVIRRGDLSIAVSTNGQSPLLARLVRERLETEFGPEYARLTELLGEVRARVIERFPDPEDRKKAFDALIQSNLLDLIRRGDDNGIKERIGQCISGLWG